MQAELYRFLRSKPRQALRKKIIEERESEIYIKENFS